MKSIASWRLADVVRLAVVASVLGTLWFGWTFAYEAFKGPLKALHPGLKYLLVGFWFTGGTIIPYLVRKPGAALLGELFAAGVEALVTQWGWTALLWGLVQGAGSELAFAATGYKRWTAPVLMLSGGLAGLCSWGLDFFYENYTALAPDVWLVQAFASIASGAVLAGLLAWALGKALERAGVRPSVA
jgi:energy-coupling factor transport system substrate-specific component